MPYLRCGGRLARRRCRTFGTFGNVLERGWNVPFPLVLLTPMRLRGRGSAIETPRGRPGRLKISQVGASESVSRASVSEGRAKGYTPRPDREAEVTRPVDTVRWKLSVIVGGDGLETPLTDTLRLIV